MKLLIIGLEDFSQPRAWSGIPYFMLAGLRRAKFELIAGYPIQTPVPKWQRGREWVFRAARKALGRGVPLWFARYTRANMQAVAAEIDRRVAQTQPDAVYAIVTPEVGLCQFRQPLIYTSDGTFAACDGYYDWFSNWQPAPRQAARAAEQATLRKAAAVIYPSAWALESAARDYGIARDKLHLIEYGANLPAEHVPANVADVPIAAPLRLLFVAVEQHRKGLDTVLDAQDALIRAGVPTQVDIVGTSVTLPVRHPQLTTVHGFLRKGVPDQAAQLQALYAKAHLFFVPSRAEAYGIVFCEAMALGLPVLARATGGVPSIVQHGVNGLLLPPDAPPTAYADAITNLIRQPQHYAAMRQAARRRYDEVLNWDTFAARVKALRIGD
ncbi:MAG: glycosyltransferase family 4 protein [Anaerolineae bacterium]|nr:glycosyltransferase family 4 protein [Anaerolineae bacterium]